jgi:hypothetical protein
MKGYLQHAGVDEHLAQSDIDWHLGEMVACIVDTSQKKKQQHIFFIIITIVIIIIIIITIIMIITQ